MSSYYRPPVISHVPKRKAPDYPLYQAARFDEDDFKKSSLTKYNEQSSKKEGKADAP